jgi:hypothetical protein
MTLATQTDERPAAAANAKEIGASDAAKAKDAETRAENADPSPTLEAVELELAIDPGDIRVRGFDASVREAMRTIDGEFLFDLPASGLANGYQRIAVVRVKSGGGDGVLLLVMLGEDGDTIKVCEPDEETAGLSAFARAFINVLERL